MSRKQVRGGWVVFAVFAAGHLLSFFLRVANAVIAGDLLSEMSLTVAQLGFMSSLFLAAFAAAQLPLGSALDRFGARLTTAGIMMIGVVGALLFAAASSFGMLALGRALMGLGTAASLMGALKALSGWFPARRFASISGTLVAVGSSGTLLAATPLAWLNTHFGWRLVFVGGGMAFFLSAALIALATGPGPLHLSGDERVDAPLDFGVIFRDDRFWRLGLLSFAMSGTSLAVRGLWAGPYLIEGAGLPPLTAGNILLAMAVGVILGFLASGWLADRFGLARVLALASLLFAITQLALGVALGSASLATLTLLFWAFGFLGSFSILLLTQARTLFPLRLTGRAVTAVNLFFFSGGFLLQWGSGIMIGRFPLTPGGGHPPQAYGFIFLPTAGLCLLALINYLPLLSGRRQSQAGR